MDITAADRTGTLRRGLFHNVGDLNLDGTLTRTRAATSSAVCTRKAPQRVAGATVAASRALCYEWN